MRHHSFARARPPRPLLYLAPLLALQACAAAPSGEPGALPDFAAPQGQLLAMNASPKGDLIAYRPLTRADFRGSEPPPQIASHRDQIGAATCAYVLVDPKSQIRIDAVVEENGGVHYRASPRRLRFRALMDRDCSWWNTEQEQLPEAYVLEHEQIHFALFELSARGLDAESDAIARAAVATGASPEEAMFAVREALQSELSAALEAALERNRRFDEETSMGFRPRRQEEWRRRIQSELARSQP
ncbi:MAG: hypothetical protein QNK04_10650 [Myxococcota bacterium]|nr:hypothetical protein [Myxococcota bacterium]